MDAVVIESRYRGPPSSGNGGYVSGLLAASLTSRATTVALRAPIPLETPLSIERQGEGARLLAPDATLIAEARPAGDEAFDPIPSPPDLAEAAAAALGFPGLGGRYHPVCFTCADRLEPSEGLRVFAGPVAGREDGLVAAPWTLHPNFTDADGRARPEILWAALDCPGSVAWMARGSHAGLLGTMTARILRRPAFDETLIVTAWPLEASGRKRLAGTAMHNASGELLAESRQIWISFSAA